MSVTDQRVIRTLNSLYRICEAGERGFETVAENVSNRGLKVLLKTYAQQRRRFRTELQAEIERLGGELTGRRSIRGIVHRGRIDIVATLTIGTQNVEDVVLKEAALGERAAINVYQRVLKQALPAETEAVVEHQYEEIQAVSDRIARLRGHKGQRLVVRLFDREKDAETAVEALQGADFNTNDIQKVPLNEVMTVYRGQGSTVTDTIISGAVGGAIWGSLLGAAAGLGVLFIPGLEPFGPTTIQGTWAIIALGGTIIGAFFGAFLGFLIAVGVAGEDTYLYEDSVEHGDLLMMLSSDEERAPEAAQIMHQVNAASRDRQGTGVPEYK